MGVLQDLAGLRMNMLNQNTMKVFKAMSTIFQDHYPVSRCLGLSALACTAAANVCQLTKEL